MPKFEWDENKRRSNRKKHGLDFDDARHVFDDPNRLEYDSPRNDEERWLTVGKAFGMLLAVVYTLRRAAIRIISFRFASKREQNDYLDHQKEKDHD